MKRGSVKPKSKNVQESQKGGFGIKINRKILLKKYSKVVKYNELNKMKDMMKRKSVRKVVK